ncbi:glycosyltransferase family 2 protein [Synechocystis sp. PCC 7339]|uniref:glycosyltransferase family 2 protein n=1 Tax=unclassified Synechocystis TaxID=2640012 RepID=UPI001BAFC514|nr:MULTISPECIES: glycosyltransferase family 2 protein [unclassified Synechocystis]QUS61643.1 glycosyltransferase family 2 protein [Synechocystis sp. PCC 7338]UAJ73842.1 glycosyltransferase family 2 protein [Synechocystis sp. PCC 7339]
MKLVSVIIPLHNTEAYIADTIRSVLAQTYTNFELIVVDDESSDQSAMIVRQFKDQRIKLIHQKNRGLAGSRNTGIRQAQGEYFAFLDADDLWLPEKLASHVEHLDQNPHIGVSFSRSSFIDGQGQPLGIHQMPKLKDIDAGHLLCRNPVGNGSAPVIRRQVLDDIGFLDDRHGFPEFCYFDEAFRLRSEDIECWIRIAIVTDWVIEGIPAALTLYRVNNQGLSADVDLQFQSWLQVMEKTAQYAPALVARWGKPAKAYQLRYLARRAVRFQDTHNALNLLGQALSTHWQIILVEPRRTGLTIAAACLLKICPPTFYQSIEAIAIKVTGALQARKIEREANASFQLV